MPKQQISLKQLAIDKDNTSILIAVGIASFLVIFSLIASNALIKQLRYQSKVIGKKEVALKQLKSNADEVKKLQTAYQAFADSPQNALGGSSVGTGDRDGENPRLVLDALPSKYDFPALTTSLAKLYRGYTIDNITGIDDEIAQAAAPSSSQPTPVEIPFSLTVGGSSQAAKQILELSERSIRPIQVQKMTVEGGTGQVQFNITAKTYFQPQKKFDVRLERVK